VKSFFIGLIFITALASLFAFSYKNNVFIDTETYCCENGLCENPNPSASPKCNSPSSAIVYLDKCQEITVTCEQCVDYTVNNCLCNGGGSHFCIKSDGSFYYGRDIDCPGR
jgi:hypothetical protein